MPPPASPITTPLLQSTIVPKYGNNGVFFSHRLSLSVSFLVGGACCIAEPFVPDDLAWLNIGLFMLGKVGVTCAFGTIYLYTSELYPTSLRTAGVGFSSTVGRVGAIISPYVALLAKVSKI